MGPAAVPGPHAPPPHGNQRTRHRAQLTRIFPRHGAALNGRGQRLKWREGRSRVRPRAHLSRAIPGGLLQLGRGLVSVASAPNCAARGGLQLLTSRTSRLALGRGAEGARDTGEHRGAPQRQDAHTLRSRQRPLVTGPCRQYRRGNDSRVGPFGAVLHRHGRALPSAPPFVVGEVWFTGPSRCGASPAQGVPPGSGVGGARQGFGHACLQSRFP